MPHKRIYIYTLLILVILSYVFTPFKEDQKAFFAASFYADMSSSRFPVNVLKTWELKPIGDRMVNYFLYEAATSLVNYVQKDAFEPVVLGIYALLAIGIFYFMASSLRPVLERLQLNSNSVFFCSMLAFFSVAPKVSLQAEHISLIFFALALGLSMSRLYLPQALAGLVLAALFYLKGISVLTGLFVYIILFALAGEYRQRASRIAVFQALFLVLSFILIKVFYPRAISDLMDAARFQDIRLFDLGRNIFCGLLSNLRGAIADLPFLLSGALAAIAIFAFGLKQRSFKMLILLLLAWLTGASVAFLQGKGFTYHYAGLLIPAVACLIIYFSRGPEAFKIPVWLNISVIACCVSLIVACAMVNILKNICPGSSIVWWLPVPVALVFISLSAVARLILMKKPLPKYMLILPLFIWLNLLSPLSNRWLDDYRNAQIERSTWKELNRKYAFSSASAVLFLTDGVANYYVSAPSYCRYFFPLPLNRSLRNPALKSLPAYEDNLACILSYKGEFIVNYHRWFPIEKFNAINQKIKRQYRLLESLNCYGRDINIFQRLPG